MQADATISIARILQFGMLKFLQCIQLFRLFQHANQRPSFLTILFTLLVTDQCSSLATHHPIHRSLYSQVVSNVAVTHVAVAET